MCRLSVVNPRGSVFNGLNTSPLQVISRGVMSQTSMRTQSLENATELRNKNPCYKEQKLSMKCLEDNGYDYDKCQHYFDNFKACKGFWKHQQIVGVFSWPFPRTEERKTYILQCRLPRNAKPSSRST
ncbi:coiled-coil-helix-coiled-coil-helix domain-containing protein 7 isoform X2 [Dermacentor variabilis]|uniref:coiled-coil-helix-coiled-coil-helix domain-containing protein 7 isoform X2 n=1 Tax=Dermacentor variabilis TaxID=34621 RepID=UPI003F5BC494